MITQSLQSDTPYGYLDLLKKSVFEPHGLVLTNLKIHSESVDYAACSFILNAKKVEYRVSKITPTKTGQFVTLWKRNTSGITRPFDVSDNIDFVFITCAKENQMGQFIFPLSILVEKGIFSQNGNGGKRGIRVYPSWDSVSNKQAEKTQNWQSNYFLKVHGDRDCDSSLIKKYLLH